MGYMVADRLEVSIFIADQEFPLDLGSGNILNFLHIAASSKFMLPQVCFSILDTTHSLDKITLQDGTPLRISLKGNTGPTITYNFRRFNSNRVLTGDAWQYTIDGYWDSVRFWTGTSNLGVRGSSDNVMAGIASDCGLKYAGTQTNDTMLWLPANRKLREFANDLAAAGYVDNNSLMKWGVDLDGTLRYVNVNNLPDKEKPTQLIGYESVPDAYTVIDYTPLTQSGFNNASTGYLNERVIQSAVGTPSIESRVSFQSDSRSPEFNTVVREKSARGAVSYSPIDFGNVHAQYERAIYQNKRYSSLFGMGVEFLINSPTKIKLFETVNFAVQTETRKEDRMFSGVYTVSGRVIYVKGATYAEKLYCTRMGVNTELKPPK